MTNLDLEAIKARANCLENDLRGIEDGDLSPAFEIAIDALRLVSEIERLRGQVDLAYEAGKLAERGELYESEDSEAALGEDDA